ncbi:MAG: replication-associated recombination protein A [Chloroflexi bacterium]|nr:MAG: AAA family ATPase [Phototrophicales bacterium]RMF81365.1 MAG: replication-associated recombination protein A [Chloroflexota bacterium]
MTQSQPLADRLRPSSLDEFIGQPHLVGAGKPLSRIIETNEVPSMIFWGPPGVGKTTLARIIAEQTHRRFFALSAVSAGKKDVEAVIRQAQAQQNVPDDLFSRAQVDIEPHDERGAILFLDEIHRFNKAQQDFLLPYVEDGTIVLIGATTENPSFEVISALLSRAQVYVLETLSDDDLREVLKRGANALNVHVPDDVKAFLINFANGDARKLLNLLEVTTNLYDEITLENVRSSLQSKLLRYDKSGEEHYDTISAFIKSMRASNVDAALYYLARMVAAGEDPKFIARRMVIFASEDVGLADANALLVANAVFRAVETIGYPEAQINLAHGTVYLARAPKDRSAYQAYFRALDDVKQHGNLPIPLELRNAPTQLMKDLAYGAGYEAYHDHDLLPDDLKGRQYYREE